MKKGIYTRKQKNFFQKTHFDDYSFNFIMRFIIPLIFGFLNKDSIMDELDTFYILLGGGVFLIMSNVYHYDLFVKKKDLIILKTAIGGMILNIILNLIMIPKWSIEGAAWSTGITFLLIFTTKYYYSKKQP